MAKKGIRSTLFNRHAGTAIAVKENLSKLHSGFASGTVLVGVHDPVVSTLEWPEEWAYRLTAYAEELTKDRFASLRIPNGIINFN